jgi:hypothetical protein
MENRLRRTLIIAIVALPTLAMAGDEPKKPPKSNPCAVYGAGYVQIEGTTTCIKIGGHISVEAGGRVR